MNPQDRREMGHEEILCHAVGERRQNYLNQIRCILEQMDDTPCVRKTGLGRKPIIEYPGYVNMKNPAFRSPVPIPLYTPTITNVPIQELRPTSEYWKHKNENDEKLQYYQVGGIPKRDEDGRRKSFELVGGYMITGCDCSRRNGLQDECLRTECLRNPQCRTDPPSCAPASAYSVQPNVDIEEKFAKAIRDNPPKKTTYCCCNPDARGNMDPRGLPKGFSPFPCPDH